jgi:hypothetical protein
MSKVPVPSNYREARESEQWPIWEQAMIKEKNSLDAHDCFTFVERPRHRKVIPVHWIFLLRLMSMVMSSDTRLDLWHKVADR